MVLKWFWYGLGMVLEFPWYGFDIALLVLFCYGVVLVWLCCGFDIDLVWFWYGVGKVLVLCC